MLEATRSLSRNNPSFYIAGAAVTLALYRARQAVKDAWRRRGEKVAEHNWHVRFVAIEAARDYARHSQ